MGPLLLVLQPIDPDLPAGVQEFSMNRSGQSLLVIILVGVIWLVSSCGVGFGIMRQGLNEGASPVRAAFVEPSQAERSLNTFRNGPSERSSDAVITVGSIV